MKLFELSNKPLPYTVLDNNQRDFRALFNVEKLEYIVDIEVMKNGEGIVRAYIDFSTYGSTIITGSGNQFLVFSTVLKILKDYLSLKPLITELIFYGAASEPSRITLYTKILKNIDKYLPGWKFKEIKDRASYDSYSGKLFIAQKDKLTESVLLEIADKPYSFEFETIDNYGFQAFFNSKSFPYFVAGYIKKNGILILSFGIIDAKKGRLFKKEADLEDDRKKFGITGAGDQFAVFATVLEIVHKYLSWFDNSISTYGKECNRIEFSAAEPSRQKLYSTFVRRINKFLPGWENASRDEQNLAIRKKYENN